MRKFECDEKACVLEPSHQNLLDSGGVKTYNEMSGGSSGLDPVESTYFIPLKQAGSTGVKRSAGKRKKRAQSGKGSLRRVKRSIKKKKKRHSRAKASRRRIKQVGAGRRKRKCVKRKRK